MSVTDVLIWLGAIVGWWVVVLTLLCVCGAATSAARLSATKSKFLEAEMVLYRSQLRWAWGKLGCRCIFDDQHNKRHEDSRCPVHGIYGDPDDREWVEK